MKINVLIITVATLLLQQTCVQFCSLSCPKNDQHRRSIIENVTEKRIGLQDRSETAIAAVTTPKLRST